MKVKGQITLDVEFEVVETKDNYKFIFPKELNKFIKGKSFQMELYNVGKKK